MLPSLNSLHRAAAVALLVGAAASVGAPVIALLEPRMAAELVLVATVLVLAFFLRGSRSMAGGLALTVAIGALMFFGQHVGLLDLHGGTVMAMATVPMSNAAVRVVDPILTNVAQGYRQPDFVGSLLFPPVPVMVSGGQIIEFDKASFRKYNARRTPGSATRRIEFGYAGKPYALVQDSLEGKVPFEHMRDASRVPGIDLGSRAVNGVMKVVKLGLEADQAAIAINAANYDNNHKVTLAGATKWSAGTGTPSVDIGNAREAIRASIGMYPNLVLLSAVAFNAAINNPNIIDRFKYTGRDSITAEMLAQLWNVQKVVVGAAVSFSDADVAADVWGNNAVVAYTNLGSQSQEEPSYGYTYTMEGNPFAEQPYQDRNAKSWIYPVTYERAPVLSGITAGYLIAAPN